MWKKYLNNSNQLYFCTISVSFLNYAWGISGKFSQDYTNISKENFSLHLYFEAKLFSPSLIPLIALMESKWSEAHFISINGNKDLSPSNRAAVRRDISCASSEMKTTTLFLLLLSLITEHNKCVFPAVLSILSSKTHSVLYSDCRIGSP